MKSTILVAFVFIAVGLGFLFKSKIDSSPGFEVFKNKKEKLNWVGKNQQDDLDGDSNREEYSLGKGTLDVLEQGLKVWQSPQDWWIDNFSLADSTGDGIKDLNLSVWKRGSYGNSMPFWVKENDASIKNHFFVFDLKNKKIQAVWQSSSLKTPNCDFIFSDVDGDGKQDLVVTEGDYEQSFDCKGKYLAVWKWNGWGFSNEWRSQPGNYSKIDIGQISKITDR